MRFLVLSLGLVLFGCSSGGTVAPPPQDAPDGALAQRMIVQHDLDDDGTLDLLTLDTAQTPFRVVEAILGTVSGRPVDATALYYGAGLDPALTEALVQYHASSFRVGERTPLDVTDSNGVVRTMVVFE